MFTFPKQIPIPIFSSHCNYQLDVKYFARLANVCDLKYELQKPQQVYAAQVICDRTFTSLQIVDI